MPWDRLVLTGPNVTRLSAISAAFGVTAAKTGTETIMTLDAGPIEAQDRRTGLVGLPEQDEGVMPDNGYQNQGHSLNAGRVALALRGVRPTGGLQGLLCFTGIAPERRAGVGSRDTVGHGAAPLDVAGAGDCPGPRGARRLAVRDASAAPVSASADHQPRAPPLLPRRTSRRAV